MSAKTCSETLHVARIRLGSHPFRSRSFPTCQGRARDRSAGSALSQPVTDAPAEAPAKKKRSARSFILPIVALGLLGAGGWYGYHYWTDGRFMISTDDAYVQADMAFVSPKISGYVDQRSGRREPACQGRRSAGDHR